MDPTEIVCTETLVASLRDPELAQQGITRNIYITSRPMGSEGATGVIQTGDLSSDLSAKIISFDAHADAFSVVRNGNPPHEPEHVPDGDIGALMRSFVRDHSSVGPVYITVTDELKAKRVETVRKVIPARQLELYCRHGPDPSARGVPFTQTDLQPAVSWTTLGIILIVLLGTWVVYYKFIRSTRPPPELPDMRPYIIEQRHGARKLHVNRHGVDDVRSALGRLR